MCCDHREVAIESGGAVDRALQNPGSRRERVLVVAMLLSFPRERVKN